jgi:Skp family chaperone for outer membrane proteins
MDRKDAERLDKVGRLLFETAMLDNGYHIEDPTVYADHVFEIMTKMTGLPHAPVMPDDLIFDFDSYAQKEIEEERAALEREKKEKRKKLKDEKKKLKAKKAKKAAQEEDEAAEEAAADEPVEEFDEKKPQDEQAELFQVLDESELMKAEEAHFKELFVEDEDDKHDRLLKERY